MHPTVSLLLVVLAGANVAAFAAMGWDKRAAGRGARRVPELRLALFVLLGGLPGLWAAGKLWRHKTIKRRFHAKIAVATLAFVAWFGGALYVLYGG